MGPTVTDKLAARIPRTEYTYDIPEACRLFPDDPREVTLVPFTLLEELEAVKITKASDNASDTMLNTELVRKSAIRVDGETPRSPLWLDNVSTPVRSLLIDAVAEINRPKEEDRKSFFASRRIGTGPG